MNRYVVCNAGGGGVTVEVTEGEGKSKVTRLEKALVGQTVELDDQTASRLLDQGKVKPELAGGGGLPEPGQ